MYVLAPVGTNVSIKQANGHETDYVTREPLHPYPGGLVVGLVAADVAGGADLAGSPADYLPLRQGDEVIIRTAQGVERRAKVNAFTDAGVVLSPTRMQATSETGSDCPHCWRQSIEGEPTGAAATATSASNFPPGTPISSYTCPDCEEIWTSAEWDALMRRWI